MDHTEKQIHDAFIDGYLSAVDAVASRENSAAMAKAESAWHAENVTHRASDGSSMAQR